MVKRGLVIFSLLLISAFLLSLNFISSATCSITTSCNPSNTVMKLYSTTNAHGALYNQGTYSYYLCCDVTGAHTCSGSNEVLSLSAADNAHAQIPSLSSYNYGVCFGEFSCTETTSSTCPSTFPISMVSLSATSNAHLAQFSTYSQKICCNEAGLPVCGNAIIDAGEECDDGNYANYDGCSVSCQEESGYNCINSGEGSCCYDLTPSTIWTRTGQSGSFTGGTIAVGNQLNQIIYDDFCTAAGSAISVRIYEDKLLGDTLIKTLNGEVLSGQVYGSWILTQADLNALGTGNSDIYFQINNPYGGTVTGPTITVSVAGVSTYCGDGTRNGVEQCEGTDLGGATCASVMGTGYTGTLSCSSTCTFVTSNCVAPVAVCGNNIREGTEECDDGNTASGDGCSSSCTVEGDTCSSLGYECGTVGGVSCGSCNSAESCSSGQCVPSGACDIISASWASTSVVEGDNVQINVQTSNCIGQTATFNVMEADGSGNPDDNVVTNPTPRVITSNSISATWVAEYQDDTDGLQTNPPEYYFIVTVGSEALQSSSSYELEVIAADDAQCLGISYCSNYDTQADCSSDVCSVAENFESAEITCGYGVDCDCYWNGNACVDSWEEWCNSDGRINVGEQCDGTNWGDVTGCSYFGYTGGTLTCNNCVFDTSQCTGFTSGVCGNNVLNTGEQCDNNILSLSNCTSLDSFTSGSLSCNNYCLLNTRNCAGGEGPYIPGTGKCIYTDSIGDTCDDGWLDRNLIASWTGTVDDRPESCHDITDRLLCPAQIKVSFFTIVQFAVAVILLIIIYIIIKSKMNVKHKPLKKKNSNKKRK